MVCICLCLDTNDIKLNVRILSLGDYPYITLISVDEKCQAAEERVNLYSNISSSSLENGSQVANVIEYF